MAGNLFSWKQGMQDPYAVKYNRAADQAQGAAYKYALENLGKQQGEELAGTPGYLAAQSIGSAGGGAGYLARMRAQNRRRGTSQLATSFAGIGAETAKSKRDFYGDILRAQKQRDLEKQKSGGLGGTLKRLAGGALGFLSGGPMGAASAILGGGGGGGGGTDYFKQLSQQAGGDPYGQRGLYSGGGGYENDVDAYGNPVYRPRR